MQRKYILGIFVLGIVAILGVSMVSAFGFGGRLMNSEITDEERTEMQEQMENAIEGGDYETWKSLMEEQISRMQEQITEENFNRIVEKHQEMKEEQETMKENMEKFCEENDCPDFGTEKVHGDFKGNFDRKGGFFTAPSLQESSE